MLRPFSPLAGLCTGRIKPTLVSNICFLSLATDDHKTKQTFTLHGPLGKGQKVYNLPNDQYGLWTMDRPKWTFDVIAETSGGGEGSDQG